MNLLNRFKVLYVQSTIYDFLWKCPLVRVLSSLPVPKTEKEVVEIDQQLRAFSALGLESESQHPGQLVPARVTLTQLRQAQPPGRFGINLGWSRSTSL